MPGVVGFRDSLGENISFDDVRKGHGTFLTLRGQEAPRAMLRALSRQYRSDDHYGDPSVVSVTTIINPVQQTRLLQRHDVYVEWDANMWAAYGSIAHGFFEDGADEGDIVEHKLVIERDGMKIGGTFDLLELRYTPSENRSPEGDEYEGMPLVSVYQGRDYKVTAAYGVKQMVNDGVYHGKPDYYWQAQLYHLMTQDPGVCMVIEDPIGDGTFLRSLIPWYHAGKVAIDNWALVAICRDWSERMHGKHIGPVEVVDVPLLELSRVENFLSQRISIYSASEMCDDAGLPRCSDIETWNGKRCAKYCAASPVCHQLNPGLSDAGL